MKSTCFVFKLKRKKHVLALVKRRNFSHLWKKSQIFNRDLCKNLLFFLSHQCIIIKKRILTITYFWCVFHLVLSYIIFRRIFLSSYSSQLTSSWPFLCTVNACENVWSSSVVGVIIDHFTLLCQFLRFYLDGTLNIWLYTLFPHPKKNPSPKNPNKWWLALDTELNK
jgi:hypothetical protein